MDVSPLKEMDPNVAKEPFVDSSTLASRIASSAGSRIYFDFLHTKCSAVVRG